MENETSDVKLIYYRLEQIESKIVELSDLILKSKLQENELAEIEHKANKLELTVNAHENRIHDLEIQPHIENGQKWQKIIDTAFKIGEAALVAFVLIKLGLK